METISSNVNIFLNVFRAVDSLRQNVVAYIRENSAEAKSPVGGESLKGRVTTMKSTGIVRKVDELGRIVLPIEMRRTLDIAEKDSLEIYVEGSSIILKKYKPSCVFCDSTKDITVFRNKNICPRCMKELKVL